MFKIKEKIKSMKCMEEILLYRKYKKDDNVKNLLRAYDNQNIILFEEKKGNLNTEKSIYHIKIDDPKRWIFCLLVVGAS